MKAGDVVYIRGNLRNHGTQEGVVTKVGLKYYYVQVQTESRLLKFEIGQRSIIKNNIHIKLYKRMEDVEIEKELFRTRNYVLKTIKECGYNSLTPSQVNRIADILKETHPMEEST